MTLSDARHAGISQGSVIIDTDDRSFGHLCNTLAETWGVIPQMQGIFKATLLSLRRSIHNQKAIIDQTEGEQRRLVEVNHMLQQSRIQRERSEEDEASRVAARANEYRAHVHHISLELLKVALAHPIAKTPGESESDAMDDVIEEVVEYATRLAKRVDEVAPVIEIGDMRFYGEETEE